MDVLFELVRLAAAAAQWEQETENPDKQMLALIDIAARRTEYSYTRLARHRDRDVRTWVRRRGHQINAVLRKHKEAVLELKGDYRRGLTESLLNGVRCVLRSDWRALLVVEPEPLRLSLVRRYWSRFVLAAALVLAGIAFPAAFPGLVPNPDRFTATLVITALFTVFSPDVQKAADAFRTFGAKN